MVNLQTIIPDILIDLRYAGLNNFTKHKIYRGQNPRAFLRRDAALALARVQAKLRRRRLSLKIWDAYRPMYAQKFLWKVFPDERYVANPKKSPRHCLGIAVDLTLAKKNGKELSMPTLYDHFSPKAHRNAPGIPMKKRANAKLLELLMTAEGFHGHTHEWWHFDYATTRRSRVSKALSIFL